MKLKQRHVHFASILGRIVSSTEHTAASIATAFNYRTPFFVETWLTGARLPPLSAVVRIADHIEWPLDELLVGWLADSAPDYAARFKIIAAQLIGRAAAKELFEPEDKDGPSWLNMIRGPMTAAEVVIEEENAPTGMYRDNPG